MDSFVPRQGEFSVLDSRPWFLDVYFRGVQWATSTGWQITEGGFSYPPNFIPMAQKRLNLILIMIVIVIETVMVASPSILDF